MKNVRDCPTLYISYCQFSATVKYVIPYVTSYFKYVMASLFLERNCMTKFYLWFNSHNIRKGRIHGGNHFRVFMQGWHHPLFVASFKLTKNQYLEWFRESYFETQVKFWPFFFLEVSGLMDTKPKDRRVKTKSSHNFRAVEKTCSKNSKLKITNVSK